jgi:hypothetical protein
MKLLKRLFFCSFGLHQWAQYTDKLREGDFFCLNCDKYMTDDDIY